MPDAKTLPRHLAGTSFVAPAEASAEASASSKGGKSKAEAEAEAYASSKGGKSQAEAEAHAAASSWGKKLLNWGDSGKQIPKAFHTVCCSCDSGGTVSHRIACNSLLCECNLRYIRATALRP